MKYWTIVLLLGLTAGLSVAVSPNVEMSNKVDIKAFPRQIAEWSGKELKMDETVYEILETRNVLSRRYEMTTNEKHNADNNPSISPDISFTLFATKLSPFHQLPGIILKLL